MYSIILCQILRVWPLNREPHSQTNLEGGVHSWKKKKSSAKLSSGSLWELLCLNFFLLSIFLNLYWYLNVGFLSFCVSSQVWLSFSFRYLSSVMVIEFLFVYYLCHFSFWMFSTFIALQMSHTICSMKYTWKSPTL